MAELQFSEPTSAPSPVFLSIEDPTVNIEFPQVFSVCSAEFADACGVPHFSRIEATRRPFQMNTDSPPSATHSATGARYAHLK